jgi:SagB-type dehydrogenase family enzyme
MGIRKKSFLIYLIIAGFIFLINPEAVMARYKTIQLPPPLTKGEISLEEAILKRRSQRSFAKKKLSWQEISQLLWACQGITAGKLGFRFRAAPSAGALYPMEIYLLNEEGLFHYLPEENKLEIVSEKDLRNDLSSQALGQGAVKQAPIDIVICAIYERVTRKYADRGIRYVHIEAGHIAQNIHLQAVTLGLSSVPIGAFDDQGVKKVLSLPKDQQPLYIIPVGYAD